MRNRLPQYDPLEMDLHGHFKYGMHGIYSGPGPGALYLSLHEEKVDNDIFVLFRFILVGALI